ncbi:phospholipase D/nuclease [Tothia fuscella]|uniref:Phospholipase n=1 Tax=Tothia fuscella TaxID=1048955 RepID=A0A9P4NPV4_9PEZI|nr:phospholipase D/nuclease [Tothia fuscella]
MSLFDKLHSHAHKLGSVIKDKISVADVHSHTHDDDSCHPGAHDAHSDNRYYSFCPIREGNDVKWYVDACGYMWAVSVALEQARESIWILDWWLSPELYLRRPPAKNEKYRIDNMLEAAAERGVKVNIIVYKEVTQALTRKLLTPHVPDYLHSLLPSSTDWFTRGLTKAGLWAVFQSMEVLEQEKPLIEPPISVSSSHTKHALEDLHPNICVFRHPDHLPDKQNVAADFISGLQNIKLSAANAAKLPQNSLAALYGTTADSVLYWAHHEKLCLVDGMTAFMGGLDLCYGRWDTNQHSIADAHPGDLSKIVFPGQDYNNSRVMDFQDVVHWQNNKLDRTQNSRMGWTDVSLCIRGPLCNDLKSHFVERWNFIYNEKYRIRKDDRYSLLENTSMPAQQAYNPGGFPSGPTARSGEDYGDRGFVDDESERGMFDSGGRFGGFKEKLKQKVDAEAHKYGAGFGGMQHDHHAGQGVGGSPYGLTGAAIQLNRSCAKWSNGCDIEHSIANAYIETIKNSEHFVYIENQFFITATVDKQKPIKNRIGAAIVERIIRAARNGERYKMIVVMPAVPAFAGDLRADDALATRAIMEFQYDSINRGGHSIYETIARAGFNPMEYIRFYNLRNYDRINSSGAMAKVEQASGVAYEDARKQYDEQHEGQRGYQPYNPGPYELSGNAPPQQGGYAPQQNYPPPPPGPPPMQQQGYGDAPQYAGTNPLGDYQAAAANVGGTMASGRWDSVAECYMLNGEDIRNVPWEGGNVSEIDAFVTEELYIHSKLLIADDRIVICGSANLNDRSQLGDHDSEIAVVIEDHTPLESRMNGQPYRASKFAASLRRQIFRKHLGLLKSQNYESPGPNGEPVGVPNDYDYGSREDSVVIDPLAEGFHVLWNEQAKTNTDVFAKVFHPVPYDGVRNWKDYDEWYENHFALPDPKDKNKKVGKYKVGHVVSEMFPGGVREVKEELSKVRGTLVEMPLLFLKEEDIAKEGISLNAFTEDVYT